ncbi:MAG TPA: DUF58 domain-containing protein [Gemmataceae bacterium]
MLSAELMRQFRRLQIRARRVVQSLLEGQYHSVFKGSGLSFEDVREYQPGDDVRSIDWNVTARIGHPFVKRFVEERELTVLLVADLSGSQRFGSALQSKRSVMGELAALIAFSAVSNNDRVGLIAGGDAVERFVPPGKGPRHTLRVLRDVLFFEPQSPGTSLRGLLDFLNRVQRRRAIVFLFSDFLDTGYENAFRIAGRFHDLIAVCVRDPREEELPDVGLVQLQDAETGRQWLADTADAKLRAAFAAQGRKRREDLRRLARSAQVDLIEAATDGGHFEALVRFFRMREHRQMRGA